MATLFALWVSCFMPSHAGAQSYSWTTLPETTPAVYFYTAFAVDSAGNFYAPYRQVIYKITPAGAATALAGLDGVLGGSDGSGSAARFNDPEGLAVDQSGNVYVADTGNQMIRKITPAGVVSTIAGKEQVYGSVDGVGSAVRFSYPRGIAVDSNGTLYVTESGAVRRISAAGVVSTLVPSSAGLWPSAVALDGAGNIFVTDSSNHVVLGVTTGGVFRTIAGSYGLAGAVDGVGTAARFNYPSCVSVDSGGNLYVGDSLNYTVRKIAPDGQVSTIGGQVGSSGQRDGIGSAARFYYIVGLKADDTGNVYVAVNSGSIQRGLLQVAPKITVQPVSLSVNTGSSATISVVATGTAPLGYQWSKDGVNISGATSSTYTMANASLANAGSYSVVVSNSYGVASSSAAALRVNVAETAVAIFSQPASLSVSAGGSATFSVSATGTAPISYQWSKNGVNIAGGTFSTYSITNASTANAGTYRVVVGNSLGNVVSDPAVLRVLMPQTIAPFSVLADKTYGDGPVVLVPPASSSGLPVNVAVRSGPALISANTLTFTGAGFVVLSANQSGDENYLPASEVTTGFSVAKRAQTIAGFSPIADRSYGAAPLVVSPPSATSGLPVSVKVKSGPALMLSGGNLIVTGVGTVVIAATQSGDSNYNAASEVTQTFSVTKASQTISEFGLLSARTFGDPPVTLTAPASSSGLPVTLSVKSGPGVVLNGVMTLTGPGTIVLSANQGGNSSYHPANEVTTSIVVSKRTQTIGAFNPVVSKTYGDPPFAVVAPTASSGLPVEIRVKSGPALIAAGTVSLTGAGTVVLEAVQAGDANYNAAAEVTASIVVAQKQPEVKTWPVASNLIAGQALSLAMLSGGSASVPGTFSFSAPSTTPSVGASQQSVTFTPSDSVCYKSVSSSVKVVVKPVVIAPLINSSLSASGVVGALFSYQMAAANEPAAYIATGLPPGLRINPKTGLIFGTPTAVGVSEVTLGAENSGGSGSAVLSIAVAAAPTGNVAPKATAWTELAGTYEGLLEHAAEAPVKDGAVYRGSFSFTLSKTGAVSGRMFYNEATELKGSTKRLYTPVTRTLSGSLTKSPTNALVYQKAFKLGSGTEPSRQELTLEVSFVTPVPSVSVIVRDFASPGPLQGGWLSYALNCDRSLTRLVQGSGAGAGSFDFSKAAGRYVLSASNSDASGAESNDAYFLIQLLDTGKILWTSRMNGSSGSGTSGLRVGGNQMNAVVYEGKSSSSAALLKTSSVLGFVNFALDSTSGIWGSSFGSQSLPSRLERQASRVSKTGAQLTYDEVGRKNWSGVATLDFSMREGMRWGDVRVGNVPEYLSGPSSRPLTLLLCAQDPVLTEGGKVPSYAWRVSVTPSGKVSTVPLVDDVGALAPKLVLSLDRNSGEFSGSYIINGVVNKGTRSLYGSALKSESDGLLRARGWVETGSSDTPAVAGWNLQLQP